MKTLMIKKVFLTIKVVPIVRSHKIQSLTMMRIISRQLSKKRNKKSSKMKMIRKKKKNLQIIIRKKNHKLLNKMKGSLRKMIKSIRSKINLKKCLRENNLQKRKKKTNLKVEMLFPYVLKRKMRTKEDQIEGSLWSLSWDPMGTFNQLGF
jgi:hypothetical protein